jgi:hypothetical protein
MTLFLNLKGCKFFDEVLACFAHRLFDVGIGKPGGSQPKESARERAQEWSAFTIWNYSGEPCPIELAEELREAIQANGTKTN